MKNWKRDTVDVTLKKDAPTKKRYVRVNQTPFIENVENGIEYEAENPVQNSKVILVQKWLYLKQIQIKGVLFAQSHAMKSLNKLKI